MRPPRDHIHWNFWTHSLKISLDKVFFWPSFCLLTQVVPPSMTLQQADNQGLRSKPESLNSHPNSSFSIHLLTYISMVNSGLVCLWMTMAYAAQTFVFLNRIFNVLGQSQPEYLSGADIFAKGALHLQHRVTAYIHQCRTPFNFLQMQGTGGGGKTWQGILSEGSIWISWQEEEKVNIYIMSIASWFVQ